MWCTIVAEAERRHEALAWCRCKMPTGRHYVSGRLPVATGPDAGERRAIRLLYSYIVRAAFALGAKNPKMGFNTSRHISADGVSPSVAEDALLERRLSRRSRRCECGRER